MPYVGGNTARPGPTPRPQMAGSTDVSDSPAARGLRAADKTIRGTFTHTTPWNPHVDPVVGHNMALGVYVTKSGRSIDAQTYRENVGAPTPPVTTAPKNPVDAHRSTPVLPSYPQGTAGNNGFTTSAMDPGHVRATQQFLLNHGFNVTVDGQMGPETASAADAFRKNHKGGASWSAANGAGTHPTSPHDPSPAAHVTAADATRQTNTAGGTGVGGSDVFSSLLSALLAGGGKVGSLLDPQSFGDAAAAPSDALASTYQRQIAQSPRDEAQHQADISNWYGLDPNANSYKLSVLGRLGTASERDQQAATDGASNVSDLAKSLVSSIGGSANDGSSSVAAAGADAAGTMAALGASSKMYAEDMAPLLTAEARGSMSRESASHQQVLLDLQDKLAQARGQSKSDRAGAVMGVTDRNNSLGQQRFANEGNLLSTLAQLQSVDPQSAGLKDKVLQARIAEIKARTNHLNNPTAKPDTMPGVDLQAAGTRVAGLLGMSNDPNHQLPEGTSPTKLAYTIGSVLQGMKLKKGTPEYQRMGQTLISMFKDSSGNPVVPPQSWFGPGS